jgi:protein-S-isoprenylcysteine O-methyltransferase Ste14
MSLSLQLRREWAPILFFALVVGIKSYYLIINLVGKPDLWQLLGNLGRLDTFGPGARYYLTAELSYLLYYVTALAFDALVLASFLSRGEAKQRPQGFWENVYPLVTVFVPVLGFTVLFLPQVRAVLPGYSEVTMAWMRDISPLAPFFLVLGGTVIAFSGAAMSIWALSYLRRSFGLRTAVRDLVRGGPYRWVRHPLYTGEILHLLGIAILSTKPAGLYLFAVALALQVIRARIEEHKFLKGVPEYRDYMASTGFLWPKLASRGRGGRS